MATLTLKPSGLRELLTAAINARLRVLTVSAPGSGKTAIMRQVCADMGVKLIVSHPAVEDPTDPKGMPWIANGRADFVPFGALRQAIETTEKTVWFLDDVGQAAPAVQAAYMQLIHGGQLGEHRISDHVVFMAATNRRTDRSGVAGILEAVKSRFHTIVELESDLDEACEWAFANGIIPEFPAFWRFKPELYSAFAPTADLTNSPTARTWEHASDIMKLDISPAVQTAALAGSIGAGAAAEVLAFVKMSRSLPNIDAILMDPTHGDIPKEPAVRYALAGALAYRATPANFERIRQYAERLIGAQAAEFAVLMVRDACRRDKALCSTQAFVKMSTSELGQLVNGR